MKINMGTIAIIIICIVAFAFVAGYISLEKNPLNVYEGRLKVNFHQVKRINGASYKITATQMKVLHGSMDYNDQVGTLTGTPASITGDMKDEDAGTWYLVVDYGTNNTLWLDPVETAKDPYVTRVFGADGDRDGFEEDYVELYFAGLGDLIAGESYKEVDISIVNSPARTSSVTFTSLTNASSIGTTSYSYKTATGYIGGFTEGDLAKIAKIELDFSKTGNETYPDSEYWKLVHLKIGDMYTYTASQFGTYDLANKRYQLKIGDQLNHQDGDPLYYEKNAGTLWANYELKAYCKYPSAGKEIWVNIKIYLYKPDGTLTSAFSVYAKFSS